MTELTWGVLGKSKAKRRPPPRYFHAACVIDDR